MRLRVIVKGEIPLIRPTILFSIEGMSSGFVSPRNFKVICRLSGRIQLILSNLLDTERKSDKAVKKDSS
jgi:hypothetical protein